jgi:hypothetical protein
MSVSDFKKWGHDYMDVGGRITSGTVIERAIVSNINRLEY